VVIGQAATRGSFVGSASISGDVSSAIPSICLLTALEQPLVILFEKDGADQSGHAGIAGKDADASARRLTSLLGVRAGW
jgi:hypothetical protein